MSRNNGATTITPVQTVDPLTYRFQRKQTKNSDLSGKIDTIIDRTLKGRLNSNWSGSGIFTSFDDVNPISGDRFVTQTIEFTFKWISRKKNVSHDEVERETKFLLSNLNDSVKKTVGGNSPWSMIDEEGNPISGGLGDDSENILYPNWEQFAEVFLGRNDPLWNESINEINKHPCFSHIFGLGHVIRMVIRAIHHAAETRGKHMGHTILWGEPGSAKSCLMDAVIDYVNQPVIQWNPEYRAVLRIDADSSTRAGIINKFITLANSVEQLAPIVFAEEVEKTSEDLWKGLLSAFDARQRIHKLTNRGDRRAHTPILGLATANSISKFESFLSGAIASRFSNKIEVSRPTPYVMEQILLNKIDEMGGDREWAQAAMELAHRHKIRDPRQIINFLIGREGLLDGTYAEDFEANMKAAALSRNAYEKQEGDTDDWFAKNVFEK